MTWWQYLMLVNIYLLLFYGFYVLLLSRETFFQLNRIYLVAAALLSFFIPLMQSDWVRNLFITQKVKYTIYSSPVMLYRFKPISHTQITIGQLLIIIYAAGIVFLTGRFIRQLISLKKVINEPKSAAPYSFFKTIKLDDGHQNQQVIAAHENAHANQWHSADVLIMEAVMIINWFNPVVYLYRFAIKHIHEFIADRQALKSGTAKADYALLLLSQTFNAPAHQLVNPFFNKSLLKQRIVMLQKNKSQRIALFKYFLSAPLFILMLILSSATVNNSTTIQLINKKFQSVLLKPADEITAVKFDTANDLNPARNAADDVHIKNGSELITISYNDTINKKEDKVFTSVEQVPEFPGGLNAFYTFLSKNIKYPARAVKNGVQGKVFISFIVEKDGSLTNLKVLRGVEPDIDNEAVRALKLSPKWDPGIQNGKPVRVMYSVPISFSLAGPTPAKPTDKKTGAINNSDTTTNSFAGTNREDKQLPDTGKKNAEVALTGNPASPLYVLDGKTIDNLNSLNPNDIESITVLKGKSSTTLYGPKGANGVVIITTKKAVKPVQSKTGN